MTLLKLNIFLHKVCFCILWYLVVFSNARVFWILLRLIDLFSVYFLSRIVIFFLYMGILSFVKQSSAMEC